MRWLPFAGCIVALVVATRAARADDSSDEDDGWSPSFEAFVMQAGLPGLIANDDAVPRRAVGVKIPGGGATLYGGRMDLSYRIDDAVFPVVGIGLASAASFHTSSGPQSIDGGETAETSVSSAALLDLRLPAIGVQSRTASTRLGINFDWGFTFVRETMHLSSSVAAPYSDTTSTWGSYVGVDASICARVASRVPWMCIDGAPRIINFADSVAPAGMLGFRVDL